MSVTRNCYEQPIADFFFFNDTATTEIYTLSLHDALPICEEFAARIRDAVAYGATELCIQSGIHPDWALDDYLGWLRLAKEDRKSTRLNSSHANISYAVFCLKKKKQR